MYSAAQKSLLLQKNKIDSVLLRRKIHFKYPTDTFKRDVDDAASVGAVLYVGGCSR